MSNNNNNNNNNNNLPPLRGNPIPQAPINHNPASGRQGPIVQVPIPRNLDGRPDYNRTPGLDLSHFVPVGNSNRLNTNPPPTEGLEGTPSFSGTNQKKYKSIASQNKNKNQGGAGEEEEEEDEGEDEEEPSIQPQSDKKDPNDKDSDSDSDYSLIEPPIMTPTSEADAQTTTELLAEKVPVELVSDILDHAEYFAHEVLAVREDRLGVSEGSKSYLTAKIPDFAALDKDTAGKGGAEGSGGRPGRVRKIVFKFTSYDQGWSSYRPGQGTYKGCWSWLDVEVWRKHGGEEIGMYRVLESLLQRNKRAVSDPTDYEITWRWDEDKLGHDDENKWESGVLNELGEITDDGAWEKGGRHERNGEFVRELKGGDEIRVLIKALYPGWRCTVERCQIECWWAV